MELNSSYLNFFEFYTVFFINLKWSGILMQISIYAMIFGFDKVSSTIPGNFLWDFNLFSTEIKFEEVFH